MDDSSSLFTCISCAVAFSEPALQRAHFASDWHRYNMKRRVATMPPVSATAFNQKVIERREQTAVRPDPKGMTCEACKKIFSTENAYRSHMASKKHSERETKFLASKAEAPQQVASEEEFVMVNVDAEVEPYTPEDIKMETEETPAGPSTPAPRLLVDADADDEEVGLSIDAKIAASRNRLTTSHCLFCTVGSPTIEANVAHMRSIHSFFIPDQDYLVDLPGLLTYLGEKVSVGNTCLYCPNGGKEFGSLEAVRGHMRDKAHCKLAYETDAEKLEVADWYNFEESYPDVQQRRLRREERRRKKEEKRKAEEEKEWEEVSDEEADEDEDVEVVEEDEGSDNESELSEDDQGVTLAADGLSLRLPSGRTLGHRSLRIYYNQNLRPTPLEPLTNSSTALTAKLHAIRARLNDPSEALIPVSGGSGGYGQGQQVMKVRNAGEARWAKNMARQGREWRAREAFKTRVGFVHNSQKHWRDHLLQ